jgi:hypothetical protein
MLRRQLIQVSAAAAAFGRCGNWAFAAPDDGEDWAFPLLGDLHFDRLEHHDHEWLKREHPGDVSQVENYSRITREMTPKLLARASESLVALRREKFDVPFVLQLGDLLEGLCGTAELAQRHAREGLDFIRAANFSAPLVMTKGNHDITGPGAADVYRQILLPFLAEQNRAEINEASFTRRRGGTLIAFYDGYDKNSLAWFAQILANSQPKRLIVAIHQPVVPYNARSSWHVYSSSRQAPERSRLLELLGRHRAIVLCGHLHKYSLLVRRTETISGGQGKFVQLAISSVAANADGKPKDERSGLDQYTPDLVELEPKHAPETVNARRELLAAEKPFIEHFDYADTWGHATIATRGGKFSANIYRGLTAEPWKKIDFDALLG